LVVNVTANGNGPVGIITPDRPVETPDCPEVPMSTIAPPPDLVKPNPAPAAPRRVARPIPTPDTCRLTITIRGADYRARPIRNEAFAGAGRAWSLRKLGTAIRHNVVETVLGPTCDCGDQVWRHEGRETACKHIRALRATGLIGGAR
jgi:hypothetical protein